MTRHFFIEPVDTLSPRGHRRFGDAGSFGEAGMPPAPSVFAGALRASALASDAARLARFERREGKPADIDLQLTHVSLARFENGRLEALFPLPADLAVIGETPARIEPRPAPNGVATPHDLPFLPVLKAGRGKPQGGLWLREAGFLAHLAGDLPGASHFIASAKLWQSDIRPGIALDGATRTGAEGALFAVEHVCLARGTGFLVGHAGSETGLADGGILRLAGDGRTARWQQVEWQPPVPPLDAIAQARRFRLVLATPGLFRHGWLPTGVDADSRRLAMAGFSARLACAAVPRAELVSGWDLLNNRPKPAQLAAPAGSVYWFDEFEGEAGKLAEWVAKGLWQDNDGFATERRAEGWNRAWLGAWK